LRIVSLIEVGRALALAVGRRQAALRLIGERRPQPSGLIGQAAAEAPGPESENRAKGARLTLLEWLQQDAASDSSEVCDQKGGVADGD
jgi:hypothetical protein